MIALLLALQLTTPLASPWSESACITATEHVFPEWEYMVVNWWPVERTQQLKRPDGSLVEWTLTSYTLRISGPNRETLAPVDPYQLSRWQAADAPGVWCASVRAEGLVSGSGVTLRPPSKPVLKGE